MEKRLHQLIVIGLIFIVLVGCRKSNSVSHVKKEDSLSSQQDISTPEGAFDHFSKLWENSKIYANLAQARTLFTSPAVVYASMATEEFRKGWQKRMVNSTESRVVKSQFSREKVSSLGGDKVEVLARVSILRQEKSWDAQGKEKVETKREEGKAKFVFVKEKGEWRLSEWLESCQQCKGTGKCHKCGGTKKIRKPCQLCKGEKFRKCNMCDGSGQRRGKACPFCKGRGKTSCFACKGKGVTVFDCFFCRRAQGKCFRCKGKKWLDGLESLKKMVALEMPPEPKEIFDLSSPEGAAATYIFLGKRHLYQFLSSIDKVRQTFLEILQEVGSEKLKKSLEKKGSSPSMVSFLTKAFKAEVKPTKIEKKDSQAVVHVAMVRGKDILLLVKRGNKWLLHNLGNLCSFCKGTGICRKCRGKQKSCKFCKSLPGKCSVCQGRGVQWQLSHK